MQTLVKYILLSAIMFFGASAYGDTKVALDNGSAHTVKTTIPGDFKSLEGILSALFTLSDQAAIKDLSPPFYGTPTAGKWKPLMSYFRGARKEGNVIIVSFSDGAMAYLSASVGFQLRVKNSIEGTLMIHFPKVVKIEYEIDGKIVHDWDA